MTVGRTAPTLSFRSPEPFSALTAPGAPALEVGARGVVVWFDARRLRRYGAAAAPRGRELLVPRPGWAAVRVDAVDEPVAPLAESLGGYVAAPVAGALPERRGRAGPFRERPAVPLAGTGYRLAVRRRRREARGYVARAVAEAVRRAGQPSGSDTEDGGDRRPGEDGQAGEGGTLRSAIVVASPFFSDM